MSSLRCELCDQMLYCKSDAPFGYGRLTFHHPEPCRPKWGRKTFVRKIAALVGTKVCIECKKTFQPEQPQSKMCSQFCVNERKNRAAREKRVA